MQKQFKSFGNRFGLLVTGLLLLAGRPVKAQTTNQDWPDILAGNVKHFTQTFAPHKVHLHTARSFYAPSDTVWFKTYLTDAASLMPVKGPEVVTVSLIAEDKKLVLTRKIATTNGLAAGQLILSDSIPAGNYTLTAYTNWMKNFSPDFFFRQNITVYNAATKARQTAKPALAALQFFPEGGNLVQGLQSKVAFKALNAEGLGLPVAGKILDETGKTVTTFKSLQAGMGSFTFTPVQNKKYTAQVTYGNNQKKNFPLPEIQASGLALTVDQTQDSIAVISVNATPDRTNETVYIVVQSRGFIVYLEQVKTGSANSNRVRIPAKELRDGITQVTVFNQAGKPEAERLYFVNNQRRLNITLTPEKPVYSRREPVKVNVQVTDQLGRPLQTELSLATLDLNQNELAGISQNILSSLLLSSDLVGHIEDPGAYFRNNEPKTREALDNLLLTQGWRRFTWQQIAEAKNLRPAFKRQPEMVLRGTVVNDSFPVSLAVIYLLDHRTGESEVILADADGKFSIHSDNNKPTQQYTFQVWQKEKFLRNAQLKISPEPEIAWSEPGSGRTPDSLLFKRNQSRTEIEKAYGIKATKTKAAPEVKVNWLTVAPDKNYVLQKYESLKDFEEVLKEVVREVRVLTATASPETRMVSKDKRDFYPEAPMYFIDGQPTWNDELILRLNADLIGEVNLYNSVKTVRPFGYMGNQGVIAINTKSGNFKAPELETENRITVPGIVPVREFYVPALATRQPKTPDLRPLVYWNAAVKTDANGNATITFPASDAIGTFQLYAEGISGSGLFGSGTAEFKTTPAQ